MTFKNYMWKRPIRQQIKKCHWCNTKLPVAKICANITEGNDFKQVEFCGGHLNCLENFTKNKNNKIEKIL